MEIVATIFDLDGTIIRSEKEWGMAYLSVLQKLGQNISSDPHIPGVSVKSNWQNFITKFNIKTDRTVEELEIMTFAEYEKLISQITLNDGVIEFMDLLKENGISLSLATSSNWELTDKILKQFGLINYFESITTGEEVLDSKPAPDIFLLASEKLGVDPMDCLVIEDSVSGITAAKDAGMKVVAISNEDNEENLEEANLVVESFSAITLKAIDALSLD